MRSFFSKNAMYRNFPDLEILDLMQEIQHHIYVARRVLVQRSQPEYGIPEKYDYLGKKILAIVLPERKEIAIASSSYPSGIGDMKVYIRFADVTRDDFQADTRVIVGATIYQAEYLQTYYDRGVPIFHHVRLTQGQTQTHPQIG